MPVFLSSLYNLLLDFWIILKTVKVVLFGGGAH